METNFNQIKTERDNQKKKIIVISAGVVLVLFLTVLLTYFITLKITERGSLESGKKLQKNISEGPQANQNRQSFPAEKDVDMTTSLIKKGWIQWQEPTDMGNLGLTNEKLYSGCQMGECDLPENENIGSSGIKYWKVGTVLLGQYAGSEIFIASSGIYEIMPWRMTFRFLKKDNSIIFLTAEKYIVDDYVKNYIESYFFKNSNQKLFNDQIDIEELDYPENLQGENARQQLTRDKEVRAFFTEAKLRPAFIHPQFGQVWMTDEIKALNENPTPYEPNSYIEEGKKIYTDIFDRQGFFLRAPDGTAVVYKFVPDIFKNPGNIIEATWNDGTRNEKEFELSPRGCGSGDYVYNETFIVNPETDLVAVGRTDKGDTLYGYRDTSLAGFSKLYNETYWVKDGEKKVSAEEFLKKHPKVFWKDPFGRLLAFYAMEIISPAECGKPVIYLYPQKATQVNVKIEPGKGLSYTEPEYKNGWSVYADENSNLVNLADGKKYPYLFWEGAGDIYYETPKQGFTVANRNLETFFDEKLAKLGLIQKEINDFKEFWIPKMREVAKPYYFVTFISQRFIDQLAPLTVEPKPDTVIRVLMDWKGLDADQEFSKLPLRAPERKGFTVVEWGGMLK